MADIVCDFCFTTPAFAAIYADFSVCVACYDELDEYSEELASVVMKTTCNGATFTTRVDSLFSYRGLIRREILSAKAGCDRTALKRLRGLWLNGATKIYAKDSLQSVMPCPSSLWSRLHGKIDLAWHFAEALARHFDIPLIAPPRALRWKLIKQTRKKRPVDRLLITEREAVNVPTADLKNHKNNLEMCLIVDDVVTTGATIKSVTEHTYRKCPMNFSALTLARARDITNYNY